MAAVAKWPKASAAARRGQALVRIQSAACLLLAVLFALDLSGVAVPSQRCYWLRVGVLCRPLPRHLPPVRIYVTAWRGGVAA